MSKDSREGKFSFPYFFLSYIKRAFRAVVETCRGNEHFAFLCFLFIPPSLSLSLVLPSLSFPFLPSFEIMLWSLAPERRECELGKYVCQCIDFVMFFCGEYVSRVRAIKTPDCRAMSIKKELLAMFNQSLVFYLGYQIAGDCHWRRKQTHLISINLDVSSKPSPKYIHRLSRTLYLYKFHLFNPRSLRIGMLPVIILLPEKKSQDVKLAENIQVGFPTAILVIL